MNGEQQKERQTAVARIDKTIASLADLLHGEIDTRVNGEIQLRDLLASMIDGETQYRKHALKQLEERLNMRAETSLIVIHTFLKMSWWRRWGWCLFGMGFLEWSHKPVLSTTVPFIPDETLRKQKSYTERPQ